MSMAIATDERGTRTRGWRAPRQVERLVEAGDVGEARHEAQHIDLEGRGEVARDHLFRRLLGALGDVGEVGGEFGIVVAARDRHLAARRVGRQAAGDQGVDLRAASLPREVARGS